METVLRDGGGGGGVDDDDAAVAAAAARRRRRLARRARKTAEHAAAEDRCGPSRRPPRQPHSATLKGLSRAYGCAAAVALLPRPACRPPRGATARAACARSRRVWEHLRPHDEAIDSAVERLDLTEEEREEATKAEEAQRFPSSRPRRARRHDRARAGGAAAALYGSRRGSRWVQAAKRRCSTATSGRAQATSPTPGRARCDSSRDLPTSV